MPMVKRIQNKHRSRSNHAVKHGIYFILFELTTVAPAWHIPALTIASVLFLVSFSHAYVHCAWHAKSCRYMCFTMTSHDVKKNVFFFSFLSLNFNKTTTTITIRTHFIFRICNVQMQLDKSIWCHKTLETRLMMICVEDMYILTLEAARFLQKNIRMHKVFMVHFYTHHKCF